MKSIKLAAMILLVAVAASVSNAAPITTITNYYAGYVLVSSTNANAGDTGLTTNTAYVCIPVASLPAATAAQLVATGTNSDVRMLLYAINDAGYTVYNATASTNRPANSELAKATAIYSASELMVQHTLKTRLTLVTTSITPE